MKLSSSAALMIRGGASRSTSGRGALITKPACQRGIGHSGAIGSAKSHSLEQTTTAYAGDQRMTEAR